MIAAFDQWATTHQYNLAAAVLPSAKGSYFSVRRSEFLDSLPSTPASRSCDFAEECFDIAHQHFLQSYSGGAHPRGKGHSRYAVRRRRSLDRCGER
jgi:hypothetical protein